MNYETIGKAIRFYRRLRDVKQHCFAKLLGVDRATLSRYENGKIKFTMDKLNEIAKALQVNVKQLLEFNPLAAVG
jgi:repressor LexA